MPRVSPDDRRVELYELGFSLREVGLITGFSTNAVYTFLRRRGIKMRPVGPHKGSTRLPAEKFIATAVLYRSGLTTSEIASLTGLSHSTIAYRIKKAGTEMRSRGESIRIRNRRSNGS